MRNYWDPRFAPHGGYVLLPAAIATMSWLATLGQDACDYARVEGPAVELLAFNSYTPFAELGSRGYRVPTYYEEDRQWRVHYDSTCYRYDDEFRSLYPRDNFWNLARRMNFVAEILGGAGLLILWLSVCLPLSRGSWLFLGIGYVSTAFFKAFSFIWFQTAVCTTTMTNGPSFRGENMCFLHYGARTDFFSLISYFVTAVCVLAKYPTPEHSGQTSRAAGEKKEEDEEDEEEEDGEEDDEEEDEEEEEEEDNFTDLAEEMIGMLQEEEPAEQMWEYPTLTKPGTRPIS